MSSMAEMATHFHDIERRLDELMAETGYPGHVIIAALLGFETEPKEIAERVQAAWLQTEPAASGIGENSFPLPAQAEEREETDAC